MHAGIIIKSDSKKPVRTCRKRQVLFCAGENSLARRRSIRKNRAKERKGEPTKIASPGQPRAKNQKWVFTKRIEPPSERKYDYRLRGLQGSGRRRVSEKRPCSTRRACNSTTQQPQNLHKRNELQKRPHVKSNIPGQNPGRKPCADDKV